MKKFISILLATMILCSMMLPVSVFAADVTYIDNVTITGLDEPKAGNAPDTTATVSTTGCKVAASVDYYDKTDKKFLKSGDKFTLGHTYQVQVYLDADTKNDYRFKTDSSYMPTVKATLLGQTVDASKIDTTAAYASVWVLLDVTVRNYIDSVNISGLDTPKAGNAPDTTATVSTTGCKVAASVDYYDKTDKKFLKSGDKFKLGHTYQIQVYLDADTTNNYRFKTDSKGVPVVKATLLGQTVDASKIDTTAAYASVWVLLDVTLTEYIDKVNISGLDTPKAGGTPDTTATVSTTGCKVAGSVDYYDKTDKRFLKSGDKFIAGHTYQVQVYLDADTSNGYRFNTDSIGKPTVKATLLGKTVDASKIDTTAAYASIWVLLDITVTAAGTPVVTQAPTAAAPSTKNPVSNNTTTQAPVATEPAVDTTADNIAETTPDNDDTTGEATKAPSTTPSGNTDKKDDTKKSSGFPWTIVFIIGGVVLLAGIGVIVFVVLKKKK